MRILLFIFATILASALFAMGIFLFTSPGQVKEMIGPPTTTTDNPLPPISEPEARQQVEQEVQQDAFERNNPKPIPTLQQNQINPEEESEVVEDAEVKDQDAEGDDEEEVIGDNPRRDETVNSQIIK